MNSKTGECECFGAKAGLCRVVVAHLLYYTAEPRADGIDMYSSRSGDEGQLVVAATGGPTGGRRSMIPGAVTAAE
jgi:hypothetical protein